MRNVPPPDCLVHHNVEIISYLGSRQSVNGSGEGQFVSTVATENNGRGKEGVPASTV